MLMPSIFGENLIDNFFDLPFNSTYRREDCELMKTDIRDLGEDYEIIMNLPGVKKENVRAELKDGYLTIQATTNSAKDEQDAKGRYIRRERYSGSCSRNFYVGEGVKQEDIKARFEDGTLKLMIPKKEKKPEVEQKKYITIE
ncbi:MAG: Hsp20/alpha crystallin family protein [Clostridiales bacterium]|nr:Hsp20/alpha crystallin family protein [Clostridiales bacterium]